MRHFFSVLFAKFHQACIFFMVISFGFAAGINSRNESAASRLHFMESKNEKLLGEHFIFFFFSYFAAISLFVRRFD